MNRVIPSSIATKPLTPSVTEAVTEQRVPVSSSRANTVSRSIAKRASNQARSGLLFQRLDQKEKAQQRCVDASKPQSVSAEPIQEVWRAYKTTGIKSYRQKLILNYAQLVSHVASRVSMKLPPTVELADLVSYGTFGLIDAIEKFDPNLEVKFETYASARIRGAIIDELRAVDWIPRSVRSKARALDRAISEFEAEHHRVPTNAEVASKLEITVSDLASLQNQLSTTSVLALEDVVGGPERADVALSPITGKITTGSEDPEIAFESRETSFLVSQALENLSAREKMLVVLYYYENRTLAEIGRLLGVTESRVSQMHSGAMKKMRAKLGEALLAD